ncbi:CHAT domain-containing protein, partial [Actinophytocola sp.]|uniref:CHAT domain-containing protein n=1 Tax=Actinophytocola sp. TaxID=1872138 RepID=UPI003D6C0E72
MPTPDERATALRVRVLVSLAYVAAETDSLAAGLAGLDEAERHARQLPAGVERSELDGLVLAHRGLLLHRAGRVVEGLEVLDEAIPRLEHGMRGGTGGDPSVLAGAYLNRGTSYIYLTQVRGAASDFARCAEVCDEYGLAPLAAKARHNLGYVDYMTGDLPTALRHYDEAERSYREHSTGMLPALQLDRARALLAAGLATDAARQLDDAIPRLREQRAGQDLAEAELAGAAAALLDGRVHDARRRARAAERSFTRRGNARWAAVAALVAMRARAAAALTSGRVPPRLPVLAVKLAETLRPLLLEDETGLALMLAVRLELRRGEPTSAEVLLDQLPPRRSTTPLDHVMLLRLCRAELAVARGDRRRALAEARRGLVELGRARDRMGGLELVCGTAIHGQRLGELAVRLVLDGPRRSARQLFGWLERTRAQVYRYEPMPAIDDPVLAEKVAALRSLRRAVQLERVGGRSARRQERQAAALEREVLRQGWYATPWGRPRPVASLAEVAAALGERALVSFAVSGDELVAVVVLGGRAGGRTRLARLASAAETAEWAHRLYADLDALAPDGLPDPIATVVAASARRSADVLDTRLVTPLARFVGERELVIVPTGALYAVPWGSLPSLRGRPVVVAPSATAWLSAEGALRATRSDGRVLLARGPRLTETIAEESALRAAYPDATHLTSPGSTVAAVLSALDGASIAHLAAHGEHEPTNAMFSRLELSDGPLFAHELSRLRHPPRHVVLAACELAMNHIRPGDEALGFAGGLLAGGVRTVVAAASRVGDAAAAAAMVDYHHRISAGD